MTEVARTREAFRQALDRVRANGQRVGFVPTMGALHSGHLELAREAKRRASYAAVSIFVNPTQFGPNEDLGRYPRDLEGDVRKCASVGVDLVFAPDAAEMYPAGDATRVRVSALSEALCGAFRPGHFEGVATVVAKLFALAAPCLAVFGRKDYQQLLVIERMARDLLFDVEVVGFPTVRDDDGLAMSSRNAYLSPEERARARSIPLGLGKAWSAFAGGERRAGALRAMVAGEITPPATRVDYVTVADPETLATMGDDAVITKRALVALAVWIEKTRLIDNLVLGEDKSPIASDRQRRGASET
jgi:pantoate--beta-alanine ligase